MRKFLGIISIILLAVLMPIQISAEEFIQVHRIYHYLPEISVEISGVDQLALEEVGGTLGDKQLTVEEVRKYDKAKDSSKIYILADVSTSMRGQLESLKEQLAAYVGTRGANDQVVMLSFGESVTELLNGSEDFETRKAAISSLQPDEEGTVLFEALNTAYEMSAASQSKFDREYILLLTDGIDFQKGSETYNEAAERFGSHILPIYTLCTENTMQEAADSLGELSRMSGGALQMVNAGQAEAAFEAISRAISDVYILDFVAASNQVSGQEELLQIEADGKLLEEKIRVTRYIADNIMPEISEILVRDNNEKIIVKFSEAVQNVQKESAIRILDQDGDDVQIRQTEYDAENSTAYIYTDKPLTKGKYKLVTQGITDISQEKNPLIAVEKSFIVDKKAQGEGSELLFVVIAVAAVIVIAAIVAAIVLTNRKAKQNQEIKGQQEKRTRYTENDGKPPVVTDIYHVKQAEGERFKIYMKLADGSERRTTLHIVSSLIFGRGRNCDVVIEDKLMSRQHFAIELTEEKMVIVDLESANGTKVNGVQLKGRRILNIGDRICAGQTDIVIVEKENEITL